MDRSHQYYIHQLARPEAALVQTASSRPRLVLLLAPLAGFAAALMFSAGTLVARTNALALIPCVAIYLGSLWYFGRQFERGAALDFV